MRNVIKKQSVLATDSSTATAAPAADLGVEDSGGRAPAPGVKLVRVEGRVEAIEVTCRCGDVSILEVEYEDPAGKRS